MSFRSICTLILGFVTAGAAGGASSQEAPSADGLAARIERVESGLLPPVLVEGYPGWDLRERMGHYGVPGVGICVLHDFDIAWSRSYGVRDARTRLPVTGATLFQAASISKPVTAVAALRLVRAGRLSLNRDINRALRAWKLPPNELTRTSPVTLAQLLSHSAGVTVHGFPGYAAGEDLPELVDVLEGRPPANTEPIRVDLAPGTRYRYSGGGYTVVQQALVDVGGLPFPRLMEELVLEPLGMRWSTFAEPLPDVRRNEAASGHHADGSVVPGGSHVYPEMAAAGLWTTPADLGRFVRELQRALGGGGAILGKRAASRMATPVAGNAGLGIFVSRRGSATYLEHGGANEGFRAFLVTHKDHGYGAIVMTNSDQGGALNEEIIRAIAREYGWESYLPEPVRPVRVEPGSLERLAGRYLLDSDTVLTLRAVGEVLEARTTFGPTFELLPIAGDTFIRRDAPIRVRFSRQGELRIAVLETDDDRREAPQIAPVRIVPAEHLEAGRFEEAAEAYRSLSARHPDDPAVAEDRLERVGRGFLATGDAERAVVVLRVNAELHPGSAGAWHRLGDAHLQAGDRDAAIGSYRKVLEVLPRDDAASPEERQRLGASARARLAELVKEP